MNRIARVLLVMTLLLIIGFVVWNDWLRDRVRPSRAVTTGEFVPEEDIVGIGAVLKSDDETGAPLIVSVLPNSPAHKAGLQAGSVIQRINELSTDGMELGECVRLIRGRAGSKLRLELFDRRRGVTNTAELIRQKVQVPANPFAP